MWILIGRIYIDGENEYNSYKRLSNYLKIKIVPVSRGKAISEIRTTKNFNRIKKDVKAYNKMYHTDFFVE